MRSKTITATEMRFKTAQMLDLVYHDKVTVYITRHGAAMAKLVPYEREDFTDKENAGKLGFSDSTD